MAHLFLAPKIISPHEQLVLCHGQTLDHGNGKLEAPLSSPAFLTPFDHLHPSDRTFDNLRLFSGEMRFGWAGRGRRDTPRLLLFRLILLLHLAKDSRQSTAKKKVKSQRSKNWSNRDRED